MLYILCCAKLLLDHNSKISCLNVAYFLDRRANLACYPKISKKICFKPFRSLQQGGAYSLICFKAKNYFDLVQIINSFAHFWKIKINIKQNFLFYFLFVDCSLMYKKGFYKFDLKNLNFKVPVTFWKGTLGLACDAHAWPKLMIFWNWTPINIPDQQKCEGFQKSKKC